MNEKNQIIIHVVSLVVGFVIGFVLAGIVGIVINRGRPVGEIVELDRQRDQLDREYSERQSEIVENQRIIGELIAECIGYAENARAITERTNANAGAAIGDLRAASAFIKQGIAEKQNLQSELDRLRTGLYRLRDMGGAED